MRGIVNRDIVTKIAHTGAVEKLTPGSSSSRTLGKAALKAPAPVKKVAVKKAAPLATKAVRRRAKGGRSGKGSVLPQVRVHRPHGALPTVAVRKRTVLDYEPGWLLLAAAPALLALRSARKGRSTSDTGSSSVRPVPSSGSTGTTSTTGTTGTTGTLGDAGTTGTTGTTGLGQPGDLTSDARASRRRPVQVVVVSLTRLRRRPVTTEELHQVDSGVLPQDV